MVTANNARQCTSRYAGCIMSKTESGLRRIGVYCGSSSGSDQAFQAEAVALGKAIASQSLGLVYGGASRGLMGAVADAALAAGGEVIGVLPDGAERPRDCAPWNHPSRTCRRLCTSAKRACNELSDAFIALPGGYGTLDELLEAVTWAQIGIHAKPCILINTAGYWDGLLAFLDSAVAAGFHRSRRIAA